MTIYGFLVAVIFIGAYITMTATSGLKGSRAKLIQWGCWAAALLTMFVCYLQGPSSPG